ncbi:hypothetical protein KW784_02300 [Candidatus Parcubacteria bacterium]|nr:hypothetical protein [Candidatus Parcubacteria bacterium]
MLPLPPDEELRRFKESHPIGAAQRTFMTREREQAAESLARLRADNLRMMAEFENHKQIRPRPSSAPATLA